MKKESRIEKLFLPLLFLAITLFSTMFFFPELVEKKVPKEKIQIEIKTDNHIETKTPKKEQTPTKSEASIKQKGTALNANTLSLNTKDSHLYLIKPMGIDLSLITKEEAYKEKKSNTNTLEEIQMNYGFFQIGEKKATNDPLKPFETTMHTFYFTDYLFGNVLQPLMEQLNAWQKENKRPIQMVWKFFYTSPNAETYPIYMNLQIYSPKTKDDITIPLNLNLMLYNKDETKKINYAENKWSSKKTIDILGPAANEEEDDFFLPPEEQARTNQSSINDL